MREEKRWRRKSETPLSRLRDPKKKKTHLYKTVRRPLLSTVLTSCRRRNHLSKFLPLLRFTSLFRSIFVLRFFLRGVKVARYRNQGGAVNQDAAQIHGARDLRGGRRIRHESATSV